MLHDVQTAVHQVEQKKHKKLNFFNFQFFFSKIMFFSTSKALIHSIWTCYEKVMNNLVFRAI